MDEFKFTIYAYRSKNGEYKELEQLSEDENFQIENDDLI